MSDVNLDFTVSNNSIEFTVQPNDIIFTPTDIQLNILPGGISAPNGPEYAVQYNKNNQFTGSSNLVFNYNTNTLSPTNLVVNGQTYLANANINANVANMHITGGTNGYVLQTDGTGNLTWTAQTGNGGGGNGSPGGSNTQIQFNDSGSFGGNVGFTFDKTSGNLNVPGNLNATVSNANYSNIANTANTANYANFAGTAYNVSGSNVSGIVANATYATYANNTNYAGVVTTNAQPNITSVGTLTDLVVSGNITAGNISGNISNANYSNFAGQVINNTQSNITSVGTLTDLRTALPEIHLGASAGQTAQAPGAVAIGAAAGFSYQGYSAVALGEQTGVTSQGNYSIAIGSYTGLRNQGEYSVAIGIRSGNSQGSNSIAIGAWAGANAQNNNSIILNATGANLNSTQANSLFVKPIRDVTGNAAFTKTLKYNPTTGEIGFV